MKKKALIIDGPTLPDRYEVVFVNNMQIWNLVDLKRKNVIYVCKAQSEAGAIRESILFLEGRL